MSAVTPHPATISALRENMMFDNVLISLFEGRGADLARPRVLHPWQRRAIHARELTLYPVARPSASRSHTFAAWLGDRLVATGERLRQRAAPVPAPAGPAPS